jgi:hypothetical protein
MRRVLIFGLLIALTFNLAGTSSGQQLGTLQIPDELPELAIISTYKAGKKKYLTIDADTMKPVLTSNRRNQWQVFSHGDDRVLVHIGYFSLSEPSHNRAGTGAMLRMTESGELEAVNKLSE